MDKKRKILTIMINVILILFLISNTVFGTLISEFENSIDTSGKIEIKDKGEIMLGVIRVIGTIVSVGMIMVLGIKYMIGSAEQKAEYKKTLLSYFIGAVLVFAAVNIADIIYDWAQDI